MKSKSNVQAAGTPPVALQRACYAASSELTREQLSLLLFLECRATDHGGLVDTRRMNESDMAQAAKWTADGFLAFGRLASASIKSLNGSTCWVTLSDEAWRLAHEERKARHARVYSRRQWLKTSELRNAA
jgi:hypothetical protein